MVTFIGTNGAKNGANRFIPNFTYNFLYSVYIFINFYSIIFLSITLKYHFKVSFYKFTFQ